MGIATFNGILHHMQNNSADRNDDEIFEDELHNTIRRLNFAEEQDEAKTLLSDLRSMAEKQKICIVEYVLLDFVMGKGFKRGTLQTPGHSASPSYSIVVHLSLFIYCIISILPGHPASPWSKPLSS